MTTLKDGSSDENIKEKSVSSIQDTKGKLQFVNMNLRMTKKLHKRIKQRALDEDTTVTAIVTKALNTYMSDKD